MAGATRKQEKEGMVKEEQLRTSSESQARLAEPRWWSWNSGKSQKASSGKELQHSLAAAIQ